MMGEKQPTKLERTQAFYHRVRKQRGAMFLALAPASCLTLGGLAAFKIVSPFGLDTLLGQPSLITAMPWLGVVGLVTMLASLAVVATLVAGILGSDRHEAMLGTQVTALKASSAFRPVGEEASVGRSQSTSFSTEASSFTARSEDEVEQGQVADVKGTG